MVKKIRFEWNEFFSWRRMIVIILLLLLVSCVEMNNLTPDILEQQLCSIGEFLVLSMNDSNFLLICFPVICLLMTSNRNGLNDKYTIILRYHSKRELIMIRMCTKCIFTLSLFIIYICTLAVKGRTLPREYLKNLLTVNNINEVIRCQILNLLCFISFIILLQEILAFFVKNNTLGIVIISAVLCLNLLILRLGLFRLLIWTPWGNVAYSWFGIERTEYRFFWEYWGPLLIFMLLVADDLNGRKDYVLESNQKNA